MNGLLLIMGTLIAIAVGAAVFGLVAVICRVCIGPGFFGQVETLFSAGE